MVHNFSSVTLVLLLSMTLNYGNKLKADILLSFIIMITIVGHMYNINGRNVVLSQRLMHTPVRFFTRDEFFKERDRLWTSNHLIHECIRDLNGIMIDIYYIKQSTQKS